MEPVTSSISDTINATISTINKPILTLVSTVIATVVSFVLLRFWNQIKAYFAAKATQEGENQFLKTHNDINQKDSEKDNEGRNALDKTE